MAAGAGHAPEMTIGAVARRVGVATSAIRYYEEIGLLPGAADRAQGRHRSYTEADVERVREIIRLRDLLGLSLDQLSELLEAETARAELRKEFAHTDDPERQRRILDQALGHIATQLSLVRERRRELEQLERELVDKRKAVQKRRSELEE